MENPIQIDRIERGQAQNGRPVINFFTEPMQYATLTLFESQYGMLHDVGIDPNILEPGKPHYTRFLAHWTEATDGDGRPKTNGKGNPYKLVERLEGGQTAANDAILAKLAEIEKALAYNKKRLDQIHSNGDLAAIKAMLEFLINNQEMSKPSPAQPETAEPDAAPNEEETPPAQAQPADIFSLKYGDGSKVDENNAIEIAAFKDFKRAHHEKAPKNREALRKWHTNRTK